MVAPTPLPLHPPTTRTATLLQRVVDAALAPLPVGQVAQLARVRDFMRLETTADAAFNVGLSRACATAFNGDGGWTDLAQAVGMTRRPVKLRVARAEAATGEPHPAVPADPALAALARSLRNIGGPTGGRHRSRSGRQPGALAVARALANAQHAIIVTDAAWENLLVWALSDQITWRIAERELDLSHGGLTYRLTQRPGRGRLGDLVDRHPGGAAAQLLAAAFDAPERTRSSIAR